MTAELAAQSIVGSYVIERELGRGGMGVVYLSVHQTLGKRAAIKVLLPQLSQRDDLVQRFWAEARAVTAIKHAGIVDVYDHGVTTDGRAYIVMELLVGESLGARLKARGMLPVPQAVAIARQVANALGAAHAVGIVHRDLKPDNIFLVRDPDVIGGERAMLLDFGVAKLVAADETTAKTMTGAVLGTPHYMSPEQCEGARAVDPRADLYSLGCTLFQMVSGRLPFESPGFGGLIGMHLHVAPPKLRDRAPHASKALEAIVARLLEKNPGDRFPSGEVLAAALADPDVVEVDAAASAPLPRQHVTSDLATAVSRVSDDSMRSTLISPGHAPTVERIPLADEPPRRRWAWIGAAGLLFTGAGVAAYLVAHEPAQPTADARTPVLADAALAAAPDAFLVDAARSDIWAEPVRAFADAGFVQPPPVPNDRPLTPKEAAAQKAYDAMQVAAREKRWLDVAREAKKVRANIANDDEIDGFSDAYDEAIDHAMQHFAGKVDELVTRGECQRARIVVGQFEQAFGRKAAADLNVLLTACQSTATPARSQQPSIRDLFRAGRHAEAVQACIEHEPTDDAARYYCALSSCEVKDKERARTFSLAIRDRNLSNNALNECHTRGITILETRD